MAQKKSDLPKSGRSAVPYIAIPRPWLIALAAVLVLPWLTVAAIWLKPMHWTGNGSADPGNPGASGKWGKLTLVPIVISPPTELVFTDWGFLREPVWFFPGANADKVSRMLQAAGVSPADADRLRSGARFEPQIDGIVLAPDPSWVRALHPETRARIYRILVKSPMNVDQRLSFRFPGSNPEEWFGPTLIAPRTRHLIEPLIYRDGDTMLLSDIELVRSEIGSDNEMVRLGKALFRQPAVMASLSVDRSADLDMLVEYWGRGGRRTEIRPLLESVMEGGTGESIDLIYLLPPFAQKRLYTYPKLSVGDLQRPAVVNCLWTSLNFFLPDPDDRYLDADVALKTLKEDYFIVEADFELGDIAAFMDEEGNIFHAAVYIADDLLFSKNGVSAMAPWTLLSLGDIREYYRWLSENPRIIFHRRKGL